MTVRRFFALISFGLIGQIAILSAIAQPLYFKPVVTKGGSRERNHQIPYITFVSYFAWASKWSISAVEDFNRDGFYDIAYCYATGGARSFLSNSYMVLKKGSESGPRTQWNRWNGHTGHHPFTCLPGDWNGNGNTDLLYVTPSDGRSYPTVILFDEDSYVEKECEVKNNPSLIDLSTSKTGDFDGNGLLDLVLIGGYKNNYLYIAEELYSFNVLTDIIPISVDELLEKPFFYTVRDLDRDGADDMLLWFEGRLTAYFGDSDQSRIFERESVYDMPILAKGFIEAKSSEPNEAPLFVYSATEAIAIQSGDGGALRFQASPIEGPWNPDYVVSGDLDSDGADEILSWNENNVYLYSRENNAFTYMQSIQIPYVGQIESVFVLDENRDGDADIFTYTDTGDFVTLHQRETPPPTETPTPTPYPTMPPKPTPTPTVTPTIPLAGELYVDTLETLKEALREAPSTSRINIAPGEYTNEDNYMMRVFPITDKQFILVGDPSCRSILSGLVTVTTSTVHFEDLFIATFPYYTCGFRIQESNVTAKNVRVTGTRTREMGYDGYIFDAEPTVIIERGYDNTVRFVDCKIEPSDLGVSILMKDCENTTLDIEECPMLGSSNRFANVSIEDCTNVTLCMREAGSPYYPRSISLLTVRNSSVTVRGGAVRGYDGESDVIGQDGGCGIVAENGSTVVIDGTQAFGGQGGAGIQRGADGEPTIVRDTSQIIWNSAVGDWSLF